MKENEIKLAMKLEKLTEGVRGNELIFDLSGINQTAMNKFLDQNKMVLDPASKKERTPWYRYKNADGTVLNVNWGEGYAKIKF